MGAESKGPGVQSIDPHLPKRPDHSPGDDHIGLLDLGSREHMGMESQAMEKGSIGLPDCVGSRYTKAEKAMDRLQAWKNWRRREQ